MWFDFYQKLSDNLVSKNYTPYISCNAFFGRCFCKGSQVTDLIDQKIMKINNFWDYRKRAHTFSVSSIVFSLTSNSAPVDGACQVNFPFEYLLRFKMVRNECNWQQKSSLITLFIYQYLNYIILFNRLFIII